MNQGEVRRWLNTYVATSLRRQAPNITTGHLSPKAKQKDVTKARAAMLAMATKLDTGGRTREPEAGALSPKQGKDHLPKVDHLAPQGDAASPERVNEP